MEKCDRPGSGAVLWGILADLFILLLSLLVIQYHQGSPNDRLNLILQKDAVLKRLPANLIKSMEAEKIAVLSESDQPSRPLADQAHTLALAMEQDRQERHRMRKLNAR